MIVLDMYLTMFSVILGGILNMLFVKTSFYKKHNFPNKKVVFFSKSTHFSFVL